MSTRTTTTQTRIDTDTLEAIGAMLPRVQAAYPEIRITRAAVLRMVLARGIDDLQSDMARGHSLISWRPKGGTR